MQTLAMPPEFQRERKNRVSSAYGLYGKPCDMITSPRGPAWWEKRRGPTTEPCGTPVCEAALGISF